MKFVQDQKACHEFIPSEFVDEALASAGVRANQLKDSLKPGAMQIHH